MQNRVITEADSQGHKVMRFRVFVKPACVCRHEEDIGLQLLSVYGLD